MRTAPAGAMRGGILKGKTFSNDRNTTKSEGRAAPERIILTDKQKIRRLHSSCGNLSEVSLLC
jgi:hypothetical protein